MKTEERKDLLEALWGEEVKQVEQLFQVVLKRSPSEQQLVVDLIPVENSEKLDRTHHTRYDTHASNKNAMTHAKLPPILAPKSPVRHFISLFISWISLCTNISFSYLSVFLCMSCFLIIHAVCVSVPGTCFTFDWLFFSLWASSTTRQAHVMEPRTA